MHLVQINALRRENVCKGEQYVSNVHTLDILPLRGRPDYGRESMCHEDWAVSEQAQGYPEMYTRGIGTTFCRWTTMNAPLAAVFNNPFCL